MREQFYSEPASISTIKHYLYSNKAKVAGVITKRVVRESLPAPFLWWRQNVGGKPLGSKAYMIMNVTLEYHIATLKQEVLRGFQNHHEKGAEFI